MTTVDAVVGVVAVEVEQQLPLPEPQPPFALISGTTVVVIISSSSDEEEYEVVRKLCRKGERSALANKLAVDTVECKSDAVENGAD